MKRYPYYIALGITLICLFFVVTMFLENTAMAQYIDNTPTGEYRLLERQAKALEEISDTLVRIERKMK